MYIYLFILNKNKVYFKNNPIELDQVLWGSEHQYFFYTESVVWRETWLLVGQFFKPLKHPHKVSIVVKDDSDLLSFELEIVFTNTSGEFGEKFLVKNYITFVGSRTTTILNSPKAFDAGDCYKKLTQICDFITLHGLSIKYIYTPFNIMWQLFNRYFYKFEVYGLRSYLKVGDIENFIFKYFLLLRHSIRPNYPNICFRKYNYLIYYAYVGTSQEYQLMEKDFLLLNGNRGSIRSKLNKLLMRERTDDFFNNCLAYLKTNYPFCTQNEDVFLKDAFVGGRREIISNVYKKRRKNELIHSCDLPSAYFQSLSGLFPVGIHTVEKNPSILKPINNLAFYNCTVRCTKMQLPVLPLKAARVIFPEGTFRGTWFGEELNLFLEEGGTIVDIHYIYTWDIWDYTFRDLADYINDETDHPKWILKAIKTTFFGSMAKRESEYSRYSDELQNNDQPLLEYETGARSLYNLTNYYNASIITSRCRIELYKLCRILLKKNIQILQLNTDSIDFLATESEFNFLKKKTPQYHAFWEKCEKYADCLYINNSTIFRQKQKTDLYVEKQTKRSFREDEILCLKRAFFSSKVGYFQLPGLRIHLNSYITRRWSNLRQTTAPIILGE